MSGRTIYAESAEAQEKGDFETALILNCKTLLTAVEEKDLILFTEALAGQTIIQRHLAKKEDFDGFLIWAKHNLLAAIEIGEKDNQEKTLPLPLFNLGKVYFELKDYPNAVDSYKKAVEFQLKSPNQRPAIIADFIIHLSFAEYMNGDKTAKERLITALIDLESAEEASYNKLVWTSGANMYLAEMLREDEPEEAKKFLQKAKDITDSDDRLTLRKEQWQKLAATFNN